MTRSIRTAAATGGLTIGLFGGSFNPAHSGHLDLSLAALRHLGLDYVWWLVSPQNPLKPVNGMAPFAERFAGARAIARHPRLIVTDIETSLGTVYTAQTLRRLAARFPRLRFVWLMGADNLATIHRWRDWQDIFERVGVAVFDRPSYSLGAASDGVSSVIFLTGARVSSYLLWARAARMALAETGFSFMVTKPQTGGLANFRVRNAGPCCRTRANRRAAGPPNAPKE